MAIEEHKLHVVFLPFFTSSHMIPMVDAARVFASRGVKATIVTTQYNYLLFKNSIDHDIKSGLQISVHELQFPSTEVGLPEGIENFSAITSNDMSSKVFHGISLLKNTMEVLIRNLSPDSIFSDMFFPWTVDLAGELEIPRLLFNPSNFFYWCVTHSLKLYAPQDKVQSDTESFLVPDLPDKIEMKRCQLQEHMKNKTRYGELIDAIKESENKSYAVVHNTFYEMEPAYADHYGKVKQRKLWHIGPLFHFFHGDKTQASNEQHSCLSWLDAQKPNSVLVVCFGSMVRFPESQLTEIALALESSNHPFIWVVRKRDKDQEKEEESWLPPGFEARMVEGKKGMIVRGWAPQLQILDHQAIKGFMTHCGWNSVLETITAGVPLITWPLFAEQFYNEKLVELLGLGVGVEAEVWNSSFEITSPLVGRDEIQKCLSRLMGGSEEAKQIRQRAMEMASIAKVAVQEGGSSYDNLTSLIEELKKVCASKKTNYGKSLHSDS